MEVRLLSMEYLSLINDMEISVISGGSAELDDKWQQESQLPSFTRVYFTQSGLGHVHANGLQYDLTPNTVCILPTGLEIAFDCPHAMSQIFFHVLATKDGHDLFQTCRKPLFYDTSPEELAHLEKMVKSDSMRDAQETFSVLRQYLLRALGDYGVTDSPMKHLSASMRDVLAFIDTHLSAQLTVDALAAHFNLSHSKLQRDFKESLGITPKKYVHTLLLVKAEHLLFNTSYSIKEISNLLGFCDQFYFSKCFLKAYGQAPLPYKNAHLNR